MKQFTSTKRRSRIVEFALDDETYKFKAPKVAPLLLDMAGSKGAPAQSAEMVRALLDWLGSGLSEADGQRILDRLQDPKDDLDVDTLVDITHWLTEEMANRPTKPSSDSRESRTTPTTSTDGESLDESTSTNST